MALEASDASLTSAALDYVKDTPLNSHSLGTAGPGGLQRKHIALLAYTDAVSKDLKVSDELFDELKANFVEKQIIDITMLIAAYNAVSRICIPLQLFQKT